MVAQEVLCQSPMIAEALVNGGWIEQEVEEEVPDDEINDDLEDDNDTDEGEQKEKSHEDIKLEEKDPQASSEDKKYTTV